MKEETKFQIQDSYYDFPYHYIPHFTKKDTPSLVRKLNWGLEYLCYQRHLYEKVVAMKPASVLEVGCGDGYFIGNLPASISLRVGVDLSSKAIAFAKAFHPNCVFYDKDVNTLNQQFDVVVAIEVLEHIPDDSISGFLNAMMSCLKKDGLIIISVPTIVLPLSKKHYRHYTIELLKDQISQSGIPLEVNKIEYIFSKPNKYTLYALFTQLFDNRLFSLEIKPFMHFMWKQVWNKQRFAGKETGCHMIVFLQRKTLCEK